MAYNPAIDHLAVVQSVREKWDGMTPGPARGWTIINEVCLRLQALGEDAGLTAKTSGTNYLGYSVDIISYHDGHWVDALYDAEGIAAPRWDVHVGGDPTLWRPPIGDVPQPPDPPTPPDPPEPPVGWPCGQEFE